MAGKKGRSGRPTNYQRMMNGNFESTIKNWVTDNWENMEFKDKLALAKVIVPISAINSSLAYFLLPKVL